METSNNLNNKKQEAKMDENSDFRDSVSPVNSETTNNSQNKSTGDSAYPESTDSGSSTITQTDGISSSDKNQQSYPVVAYEGSSTAEDNSSLGETEPQLKKLRPRHIDASKIAQTQVNRLRKETKLKRLKKELKEMKAVIKRGYKIKKNVEKFVKSDGTIAVRVIQKNQSIDSASKVLIQNKCVQKESEIYELQEILKNLKREVKHKASTNLHATRYSFARRKKEVNRSKLINRYKSWLTEASNTGGRSLISQALMLSKQGEMDMAREKIITLLTSTRIKNHPRTKSVIEFDEEIGKELLNYLNKIIL